MRGLRIFDWSTNNLIIKNISLVITFCLFIILSSNKPVFSQTTASTGSASYYGNEFQGRKTASGQKYDKRKYTAAHRTYSFGTKLKVTNLTNGKSVVVTVNDRGPYTNQRLIDLSYAAAKDIDMIKAGIAQVRIDVVSDNYSIPKSPTKKQPTHIVEDGFYSKSLEPISRPSGYILQVGSFSSYKNALTRIDELHAIKIGSPCIEVVTVRKKKAFRVLYSGFSSKELITAKQKELKKKGFDSIVLNEE
jgi:rare lipoprotein A